MRLQISSAKIFSCCLAARKWPTTDPLVPQGWHWVVDSISFWVDFTNILQGYVTVTGTIKRLTQCKSPIWYGWITHIDPIGTRYTTSPRQSTSKPRAYLMGHTAPWIRLDPGVRPLRHIYFIKSYFCQHVFPITAKLVNSLRPSDAYMRQKPNPSLIQIMARRHSIIWTNDEILLIGPLGICFNKMLIEIHTFSFAKMHLKMSSGKWRPFCLGLNVLNCA